MALIKLTVTKTNHKALINISRIESIMPEKNGSSVWLVDSDTPFKVNESQEQIERMVLRDQFAMSAMNGVVPLEGRWDSFEDIAIDAYDVADAMLEERGKCTN